MKKENESMRLACDVMINASALAAELGLSRATVSEWCTGGRPVPPARALQIEAMTAGRKCKVDAERLSPANADLIAFMRRRARQKH